jgi:streptogramin lyase
MIAKNEISFVTRALAGSLFVLIAGAVTANALEGKVLGGGKPVANSTVTLWAAGEGAPQQLGQARTGADGGFTINPTGQTDTASLYLIAKGGQSQANTQGADNPGLAFLAVLGNQPPASVTINEFTTVASVWTHNQFIDGTIIKGPALSLRIAAGNVPNFVNLATGGYGATISDALNSTQTPTLANFGTLANVIAACATGLTADACPQLYIAATPPKGETPNDTLTAAESIARYPSYQPEKIFALLEKFYPVRVGKLPSLRPAPFMPYLTFAPTAWVLPLKFAGGGYHAGGKLMFDSQGNVWNANNMQAGSQTLDAFWQGTVSKFAPDGKPLSPALTGFTGGGLLGPGFGLAIDANDNAWLTSFAGNNNLVLFDKNGKALSPPEGYTFGDKINKMQGIIVTPGGDVWAADTMGNHLVQLPKGDPSKGQVHCTSTDPLRNPCKVLAPFALAVDQKDNIWVSNILGDHVTRFPAGDPTKAETFKTGWSGSGLAIDSLGNVWVTNKLGNSERGRLKTVEMAAAAKINYDGDPDATSRLTHILAWAMFDQKPGWEGGSVTVLQPDGKEAKFSPVYGKGIYAPWAISVDGNDNIWITNFARDSAGIVQLCGFRTENCPPGLKTGDAISPPGGYVGGGLQLQVDVGFGPAGDVWVTNNWEDPEACYGKAAEGHSTRCGGQGMVVFFGMAKPVRGPLIGPARPL